MSIFLLIDGHNGGSTDPNHLGWFEIESVQLGAGFGVASGITSKPSFSEVTVSLTGLTPELLADLAARTGIGSIRIEEVGATGAVAYDLRLGEVHVTGDSFSAGGSTPSSSLSFSYGRIGLTTPTSSFGYDIPNDIEIDPATIPSPMPAGPDGLESGAVSHYFLLINDGNVLGSGESKAWFEINSVQLGAGIGGGVAGPPSFSDLTVTLTGVSPDLLAKLAAGTSLSSIQVRGENAANELVYDLRLGHVFVTGESISTGGATPSSSLSFEYDRIGLITPSSSFGYDTVAHGPIDPATLPSLTKVGPDYIESGAVSQFFLLIDGVNGGAVNGASKAWFEINSLQLGAGAGVANGVASAPSFSEVTVTLNGLSPELLGELATGKHIGSAEVQGVDSNGAVVYDLRMGEVILSGDSFSSGGGVPSVPSSSLSLNYGRVGLITPEQSFGYDVRNNTAIAPAAIASPTPDGPDVLESGAVSHYYLLINPNPPVGGSKAGAVIDSKAWFEIDSLQLGAGVGVIGGVAGPASFSELTVSLTGVSPDLLTKLATGTSLSSIEVRGENGANQLVYDLRLGHVLVTGESISTGGDTPHSSLSFAYDRIGLITPTSSFGYDTAAHSAIDPTSLPSLAAVGPDYIESAHVSQYFLLIDGVNGGALNGASNAWFDINSLQLGAGVGADHGVAGTPAFSDVMVTLTGLSPELLGELAARKHIGSAEVQGVDSKGAVVYDLRLGEVLLTGDSFSSGGDTPSSSLSFNYGRIGLTTPGRSFGYDIAANSTIDPTTIPLPAPGGSDVLESGAVSHYVLLIDGVDGGSTDPDHLGSFEINSLQLGAGVGARGGVVSKPSFSELTVTLTGVSPDLLAEVGTRTDVGSIRVEGLNGVGDVVYDLRLGDVFLTGYSMASDGTAQASLSINYERIGLITPSGNFGYDIQADIAIDPNSIPLPVIEFAPVVTLLAAGVGEDGPAFSQDLLTGASDPNRGTTLVVQDLDATVTSAGGRVLTLGGDYTLTGSTLALTAAGFTKFDSLGTAQTDQAVLHFRVSDGTLTTANTLTLTINGVNDPAVLGSADVTVPETNAPITATGVLSIHDVDSPAAFVAQPATAGHYGVFTIVADGTWTYKANLAFDYLNAGDSLKDTFQVKSTDGGTSSVGVTIAGTPETSTVRLGDAPAAQSGTGGQWAQAWTQAGYAISHKADYSNAAEAWSAVKFNAVSSQLLSGGDIYAGDLGVSGQSAATSTVKQEIDGKEALRVSLPASADSVTIKLARLFTNDDGSALSESGLLRLLDSSGHVVAEKAFWADAADGAKTVTLGAAGGFASMELLAGAYNGSGSFVYGGYSTADGGFGGAISADGAGKLHGSDFLLDWVEFSVPLVGLPATADAGAFGTVG